MAFVQAVGSQNPVSAELIVAPRLDDVLVHSQKVASTLPERAQPTFDETVERQPMKRERGYQAAGRELQSAPATPYS